MSPQRSAIPGDWRASCVPKPACAAGKTTARLRNSAIVLMALGGLAAVDILLLLPLLFAAVLTVLVLGLVIFVLGIIGVGLLLSVFKLAAVAPVSTIVLRVLASIGLISASAGIAMLLFLALNGAVRKLGDFARLHYRLLKPEQHLG